jgi:hypothetical protein
MKLITRILVVTGGLVVVTALCMSSVASAHDGSPKKPIHTVSQPTGTAYSCPYHSPTYNPQPCTCPGHGPWYKDGQHGFKFEGCVCPTGGQPKTQGDTDGQHWCYTYTSGGGGSQGGTGDQGSQGSQGGTGYQGSQGGTGYQGSQGGKGDQGSQGGKGWVVTSSSHHSGRLLSASIRAGSSGLANSSDTTGIVGVASGVLALGGLSVLLKRKRRVRA